MTRRLPRHPAVRPFRLTRSAVEDHQNHLPTPFLGCAACVRRAQITPLQIGWVAAAGFRPAI
jgi:hypothetical protein